MMPQVLQLVSEACPELTRGWVMFDDVDPPMAQKAQWGLINAAAVGASRKASLQGNSLFEGE